MPRHLTQAEIRSALTLHEAGKSQVLIAEMLGVTQPTISRLLDHWIDTRREAKAYLNHSALSLAERVAKDADVDQALEVLDRLDVAQKRQTSAGPSGVQIIIGMPGQPAGLDPLSELQPHTFAVASIEANTQVIDTQALSVMASDK